MQKLVVVSNNINGIRDPEKRSKVASRLLYMKNHTPPDIVCLQETHCTADMEQQVLNQFQYEAAFAHGTSQLGGLATLIKCTMSYAVHAHREFHVDLEGRKQVTNHRVESSYFFLLFRIFPTLGSNSYFFTYFNFHLRDLPGLW